MNDAEEHGSVVFYLATLFVVIFLFCSALYKPKQKDIRSRHQTNTFNSFYSIRRQSSHSIPSS
jgi:hypothetical protein